jgi:hypothetical protein
MFRQEYMAPFFSNTKLFAYTLTQSTEYTFDDVDYSTARDAFNRWDELIRPNCRFEEEYTIEVEINIDLLEEGTLGSAYISYIYYFDGFPIRFGNVFPAITDIALNKTYITDMKKDIRTDGKSEYYYVLLHEIGHILGIGSFWKYRDAPMVSYIVDNKLKYYYTGVNALREYNALYQTDASSSLVGIPIEDDGGSGTKFVHPEEGEDASANQVLINGITHYGLGNELMTGWVDASPSVIPLSRITLGFLEDIGFEVNYELADKLV